MKNFFSKIAIIFCFSNVISCGEIEIERVLQPNFSWYEPLFVKFLQATCASSSSVNDFQGSFLKEAESYESDGDDKIFLQATLVDEVVGYLSCHIQPGNAIYISQLAFDPEKYDNFLIKELLFALFQSMPNVKNIIVQFPHSCVDLVNLFTDLGFSFVEHDSSIEASDLLVAYQLKVHSKCAMCKILYGPGFWDQDVDDDSDWGFCSLDANGDLCPTEDDNFVNE